MNRIRKCRNLAPHRQRGITLVETVIVIVALLIMLTIGINFAANLTRQAQRSQVTDQEAREMAQIARATKQYIAAQTTAFTPNVNVVITTTTLANANFLPTTFADRAGTGGSLTPLGRGYNVVIRALNATDPPTAVVYETGASLAEKLPSIGIDSSDGSIAGLKQDIAAQMAKNYQSIAGTIAKGSRTANGVNSGFSKDLSVYFASTFTEATPVALVNFKDLDPDNGTTTPTPTAGVDDKVYEGCQIYTKYLGTSSSSGNYYPGWASGSSYNLMPLSSCKYPANDTCPSGPGTHYEGTKIVSNCDPGQVTPLGTIGSLTNNMAPVPRDSAANQCPNSQPGCQNTYYTGTITMNQATIVSDFCYSLVWVNGTQVRTPSANMGTGMYQTFAGACCAYHWKNPVACH